MFILSTQFYNQYLFRFFYTHSPHKLVTFRRDESTQPHIKTQKQKQLSFKKKKTHTLRHNINKSISAQTGKILRRV